MIIPTPEKVPTTRVCVRCSKRKLIVYFLILKGNISQSCSKCLDELFANGKINHHGGRSQSELKKARARGSVVIVGRPQRQPKPKERY